MKILITGGAGYIGSHLCVELLGLGHEVIVIDNLVNSKLLALERVAKITKKKLDIAPVRSERFIFHEAEIGDRNVLQKIFKIYNIDSVIHLSGLKSVDESIENPLEYYKNNVTGSIVLLDEMAKANVKNIVFSSSAAIYGNSDFVPIKESSAIGGVVNPYGRSKFFIEEILKDIYKSDPSWNIGILRYFNPIGAHPSGIIGEDQKGSPNNLMPYISQVATGKIKKLKVFGADYPTRDGTGIRDYIHVCDLAKGHVAALKYLSTSTSVFEIFNIGTGRGYSVFEMVHIFEKVSGKKVPYEVVGRRSGDVAECWASTNHAEQILKWRAQYTIEEMCEDFWRWQQLNPDGYVD